MLPPLRDDPISRQAWTNHNIQLTRINGDRIVITCQRRKPMRVREVKLILMEEYKLKMSDIILLPPEANDIFTNYKGVHELFKQRYEIYNAAVAGKVNDINT